MIAYKELFIGVFWFFNGTPSNVLPIKWSIF